MIDILAHLFTPRSSNNYKAKALHLSSLSIFMLLIMLSQIIMSLLGKALPGILGIASNITASELISLTNAKRAENGLPALQFNQTLVNAAGLKGADMVAKNYWAHTAPDGTSPWTFFQESGYGYVYAGENLARDFLDSQSVVSAWMNSATHKDNLLSSRYKDVGIAVIHGTFQGQETTLIVQLFGTPAAAPPPVADTAVNQPVVAVQNTDVSQAPSEVLVAQAEAVEPEMVEPLASSKLPSLSSFSLTKAVSISLTLILLTLIIIDVFIITRKRIVRLSGNSLIHLTFLGILLIILLVIRPGLIL